MREREAKALASELSTFREPLVVTGDFNDFDLDIDENPHIRSSVLSTIRNTIGLATAAVTQSLRTSTVYGVLIDHILTSKHWQIENCIIHKSDDSKDQEVKDRTSDHFPVSALLKLK